MPDAAPTDSPGADAPTSPATAGPPAPLDLTGPPDPPAVPPPTLTLDLAGHAVGDFQVLRRLGSGGMGQVYLARQISLKREVALKVLRPDLTTNPTALKRFQAEAEAVARLNHPNIVQVYSLGEYAGMRYMALEYVEGRNLRDYLERKGPPDLPISLSIMRQVGSALQKAHEQGIVHRDIKPENILLTRKVGVKVTDFGLFRVFAGENLNLTQSGVTMGTPLYLSPEQAQGHAVDHRSDIYSFGVTCYHLLAGEVPFRGTTAVEVALKHVSDQPRPLSEFRPDLPADLCELVHKMMAKRPDDRYQSARDFLRDLAKLREGLPLGLTQTVSLGASAPLPAVGVNGSAGMALSLGPSVGLPAVRRFRWRRWAVAAALVLAGVGVGVGAYLLLHPPGEAAPRVPTGAGAELSDIRPPERLNTARERELLAVVNSRGAKGDDVIAASVELGLLYVREAEMAPPPVRDRLLEEARVRFEALEKEKLDGPISSATAQWVGKVGRAVVLAPQNRPAESNALFQSVLNSVVPTSFPKGPAKVDRTAALQVVLLRFPELPQAVAESLNRNAVNMAPARLPRDLDILRTPRGIPRPPG